MAYQRRLSRKLIGFAGIVTASFGLAFMLLSSPLANQIESRTWDWRAPFIASHSHADAQIKIIVIDQTSLDYLKTEEGIDWQWPRQMYGGILHFLELSHARAVGFDMLFTEGSLRGKADDVDFAAAVRASAVPVVFAMPATSRADKMSDLQREFFHGQEEKWRALSPLAPGDLSDYKFTSAILPNDNLLVESALLGHVSADPDADGVYRHHLPFAKINDVRAPSLPVAMLLAGHDESLTQGHRIPPYPVVRFKGPAQTYESVRAAEIFLSLRALEEGHTLSISLDTFKNAYVLVGTTAPGLLDLRATPIARVFPGVEFNATVIDNLRHGDFITSSSPLQNLLILAILLMLTTGIALFGRNLGLQLGVLAAIGAAYIAIAFFSAAAGVWLPLAVPLGTALCSVLLGFALQFELEGREHRFIKNAFRYYVSPAVIDEIVEDPAMLSLGGERRVLTMFFSDIRGFTSISERLDPQLLVMLLNEFLSAMTDIILANGGTLDKYVGDAIIAFWNAPLRAADHETRAVEAALACQEKLAELRPRFLTEYGVELYFRIGLNTGQVTVGNFGSQERFNYTMIGDAANLASRLEGANKFFGTSILVAEATFKGLQGVPARKVAELQVVGKTECVPVYEPFRIAPSWLPVYESALQATTEDPAKAITLFRSIVGDPVSEEYASRLERGEDCVRWTLEGK